MPTKPTRDHYGVVAPGHEPVRHGTPLFPVGCYFAGLDSRGMQWHWHDELEAVLVVEGGTEVCAADRRYVLEEGQGFFINAGVLHTCRALDGGKCAYHSMVFHPRLIGGVDSVYWQRYVRPLTGNAGLRSLPLDPAESWQAEALRRVEEAWQACRGEEPGYEFRVRSALSGIVLLLTQHMPAAQGRVSGKEERDGERIKLMLRLIEESYMEELSVADIAAGASVSESECLRCFKSTIGTPPIQYLKLYRVQRAAELLASTDRKIQDIAGACGFQDMSYFTKTFRELKGVTPGEYRRTLSAG